MAVRRDMMEVRNLDWRDPGRAAIESRACMTTAECLWSASDSPRALKMFDL